jgi:Fe-S cluster biogenesis protein NfuA
LDTVNKVIEEKINPVLAVDRGAVEVAEVRESEGVVVVRYKGRCAGCPAAPITHSKIVTAALLAADRSIRKVEYTMLEEGDGGS